jgi:outer membrane protein OmpA-like peptidoglycan-associated protein
MRPIRVSLLAAAVAAFSLVIGGCATKKNVREAIAPVQNQLNTVQKQSNDDHQSIGDLDRQVATADEKATDAGKRADAAAAAAANANSAAQQAQQQADAANSAAQMAQQNVSKLNDRLTSSLQNLDNYKLMTTERVFFPSSRYTLSREDREKLDNLVQNLGNMRNYVIEVEGFADHTGDKTYNLDLSRKRADAVVHYISVEHNIPLRDIRQLGAGADFPDADNSTRDARKENRRVEVRVYALDLNSGQNAETSSITPPVSQ